MNFKKYLGSGILKNNCRSGIARHLANVFEQQGTW